MSALDSGIGFRRIAIVDRGEAAMRCLHAVRELESEMPIGMRTIALFTDVDRRALYVREANEAVPLGAASFVDARDGQRKSRYLDYAALEGALHAARAEAVWVGWGALAADAIFAELCARLGVVLIGPSPAAIRAVGDRIAAKRLAEQLGLQVVPWSGGPVATLAEARTHAGRLGWPVLVKAATGADGRGLQVVGGDEELAAAFAAARADAQHRGVDPAVFVERAIVGARHLAVQAIGDRHGACWILGVRDCSVQRRHRTVAEESPATLLAGDVDESLRQAATRMLQAVGCASAATVEFLYDPATEVWSFLEVHPYLQAGHAVTEMVTGLDLVKLQLHVARGGRLDGTPPVSRGHAIAVALLAEDPDQGFAPAPGTVARLRMPTGSGLRVETGVGEGAELAVDCEALIARIVAWGTTRAEALARLRQALRGIDVVVAGGTNAKAFLLGILERPEMATGEVDTDWVDGLIACGEHVSRRYASPALLAAAVEAYEAELAIEETQFFAGAARGRPAVQAAAGHTIELRLHGQRYAVHARKRGAGRYALAVDQHRIEVEVERLGPFERRLVAGGARQRVVAVPDRLGYQIEVEGVLHRIARDEAEVVRATAPGIVVTVVVREGERVRAGDRLVVLEAMKMEMGVFAPGPGRVGRILVTANMQVGPGAPLVSLEPDTEVVAPPVADDRVDFTALVRDAPTDAQPFASLRDLVLGFDVEPAEVDAFLATRAAGDRRGDTMLRTAEDEVLTIFADISALFRPRQVRDDASEVGEADLGPEELLRAYLRAVDVGVGHLPEDFVAALRRTLAHYGVVDFATGSALRSALHWLYKAHHRRAPSLRIVLAILERRLALTEHAPGAASPAFRAVLDRLVALTEGQATALGDLARQVHHHYVEEPLYEAARRRVYDEVEVGLRRLATDDADPAEIEEVIRALVECPQPLVGLLLARFASASPRLGTRMLEVLLRRYYRIRSLTSVERLDQPGCLGVAATYGLHGRSVRALMVYAPAEALAAVLGGLTALVARIPSDHDVVLDLMVWRQGPLGDADTTATELAGLIDAAGFPRPLRRVVVALAGPESGAAIAGMQHFTFRPTPEGVREERVSRNLHPMMGKRLQLWRLAHFDVERLPSSPDVYLLRGVARDHPQDERLFAFAEVRDVTPERDDQGAIVRLPELERMFRETLAAIRDAQAQRAPAQRLHWNRILLYVWPPLSMSASELQALARRLAPATQGLGLEKVVVRARVPVPGSGTFHDTVMHFGTPVGRGLEIRYAEPADQPIRPLTAYGQKVVRMRQRGLVYPYEIVRMLTPPRTDTRADVPPGEFVEHDLDPAGNLVPVDRPPGGNTANIVVGLIRNFTPACPEGMTRVLLLGDPSHAMGALAEPECRRINAALDLAERLRVPLEWVAISAGAKISMESGTENMDWISRVLRRLIDFTQAGGEVNVLVAGINVGAQPYWNAEATMLMHTRGILVMVADGAMVLTGKSALDFSGGVSAEDNQGIGGYERIMGPNGQAQYWARDISDACRILLRHYEHCYVVAGERFPRRVPTSDPIERDVCAYPHVGFGFATVGEVFSEATNPGRKRPFDIRTVMLAALDQDHPPLERWAAMRDAEIAVVWDAHLGGWPVCVLGIESHPLNRLGYVAGDGPDQWTAGTLFPRASKKIARAINAASANRPLIVLANLSGFDGSPESMRNLQLEYGAEIGRAVVNFRGPIVFCVVSRYHGGAFVVFSRALNEQIEAAALEGTHASVIGGAPAAAVVFAGEVDARTRADARVQALDAQIKTATGAARARLRVERDALVAGVHSEKLGQVAAEFDHVHSVHRALAIGSLDRVIAPELLRPYLVDAVTRGIERELAGSAVVAVDGGGRAATHDPGP